MTLGAAGAPTDSAHMTPAQLRDRRKQGLRVLLVVAAGAVAFVVGGAGGALATILILAFSIMFHEFGHYSAARLSGMKCTEYFIGFGPRLWSVTKGETEYGVKAVPLGGYVRIIGMNNLEAVEPEDEQRTYRAASYPRRALTIVAGPAANFVLAFVLVAIMLFGFGFPETGTSVGSVAVGTPENPAPAFDAGFRPGDRIVNVAGVEIQEWIDVTSTIEQNKDREINVVIERDGELTTLSVTPIDKNAATGETTFADDAGYVGLGPNRQLVRGGFGETTQATLLAVPRGMQSAVQALGRVVSPSSISGLIDSLQRSPGEKRTLEEAQDQPQSVIGIVTIGDAIVEASDGWQESVFSLLSLGFSLNIFLGVFNLVPILPLDGGHFAVAAYERIRSRRGHRHMVDFQKLAVPMYAFIGMLLVLFVSTAYLDIFRPLDLQ